LLPFFGVTSETFRDFTMLIALVGPDRYLVGQALQKYLDKYASDDGDFGGFNLTRLDGARLLPDELMRAVQAMGFFGDSRLVVVDGLLTRFGGSSKTGADGGDDAAVPTKGRGKVDPGLVEGFSEVFASLPEGTVLILVERGAVAKNSALLRQQDATAKLKST
jgi:hypothetical protein